MNYNVVDSQLTIRLQALVYGVISDILMDSQLILLCSIPPPPPPPIPTLHR